MAGLVGLSSIVGFSSCDDITNNYGGVSDLPVDTIEFYVRNGESAYINYPSGTWSKTIIEVKFNGALNDKGYLDVILEGDISFPMLLDSAYILGENKHTHQKITLKALNTYSKDNDPYALAKFRIIGPVEK